MIHPVIIVSRQAQRGYGMGAVPDGTRAFIPTYPALPGPVFPCRPFAAESLLACEVQSNVLALVVVDVDGDFLNEVKRFAVGGFESF